MKVSVRSTATVLALGAIALSVIGLAYAILFARSDLDGLGAYAPRSIVRLLDLDTEGNIPTWFQSSLLLLGAMLCALFASTERAEGTSWRVLGVGLLVMSCDETAAMHEISGRWLSTRMAQVHNVYYWLVPGTIVALALVVFARRAARALDPQARRRMLLAGLLFLSGALGLEGIEAIVDKHLFGTAKFGLISWAEESLEMAGVIVFIHALMAQLRERGESMGIVFTD